MQKLNFIIASCTSEDPDFPATELIEHGSNTKGWQSSRFCQFPQIIVVQFVTPSRLKQIQFLSHQHKIATRIDLYTYMPQTQSFQVMDFQRLGYVSLDSNEKSNYQARELKSVYVNVECQFLKLVFQQPHLNRINLTSQVSLIALNCIGHLLEPLPPEIPQEKSYTPKQNDQQEPQKMDAGILEKLKALEIAKNEAVSNEDFDEAQRIKEIIDTIQSLGYQITQLEQKKLLAIQQEDFESAKIFKQEICRLQGILENPPDQFHQAQQQKPVQEQQIIYQQIELNEKIQNLEVITELKSEELPVSHDEQVIPTLKQKNVQEQQEEQATPNKESNEPEALGSHQLKLAEPLLPYLGEDLCKKLFSKQWSFRESALEQIVKEIQQGSAFQIDQASQFNILSQAIKLGINDQIQQVSIKAIGMVKLLLDKTHPPQANRGNASEGVNNLLINLIDKSGESNTRIRENAEQAFMQITRSPCCGQSNSVNILLKPSKHQSNKFLIGKLNLLTKIVEEFKCAEPAIIQQALVGFKNSNSEIRNASYQLLLNLNSVQNIQNYLTDLRPVQLEMLEKGFAEKAGTEYVVKKKQAKVNQREQQGAIVKCNFCGKQDSSFTSQDKLDIHFWKDCPMLFKCLGCKQIIEILRLNSHLLNECDTKAQYKQCPRCMESIHIEEFDQHSEEQSCIEQKAVRLANRCPLCHQDVQPGENGWKQHILVEGCPNNERTP